MRAPQLRLIRAGLVLGLPLLSLASLQPVEAQRIRGGVGGPASGAGALPGVGFGQAGPGLVRPGAVATPAAGGVGGPASGAGALPGVGFGQAGPGLVR